MFENMRGYLAYSGVGSVRFNIIGFLLRYCHSRVIKMLFRISPNQGQPHHINRMRGAVLRIKTCLIIPIKLLCNKFVLLDQ